MKTRCERKKVNSVARATVPTYTESGRNVENVSSGCRGKEAKGGSRRTRGDHGKRCIGIIAVCDEIDGQE